MLATNTPRLTYNALCQVDTKDASSVIQAHEMYMRITIGLNNTSVSNIARKS